MLAPHANSNHAAHNVVVTGASAGVGRATAHRFARSGARIALIARDAQALHEVKSEVERLGGNAIVLPIDVAEADAVFTAAETVVREFGSIDVWVNDAMVTVFSPVWEMSAAEFRRVTEVTYLGFVNGTMAALRHMRARDCGTIIQVGSALAYRGIPLQAAYCGAKHAIRGFTDSLRGELIHAGSNIALTIVELPAVNTPQFDWARTRLPRKPRPVAPVFQPEAIADVIFRAALDPKREYWIGWSTLKVILANLLVPEWLDRYLARVAVSGQETEMTVAPDRQDNLVTPVHELHRTRGSFGREARESAVTVIGPAARLVPFVAAGLLAFGMGFVGGALAGRMLAQPRLPAPGRLRAFWHSTRR